MSKVIVAPAVALAALGIAFASVAAEPKAPPPKAPAAGATSPASSLELSAAQRGKLETLRAEGERQLAPLREQLAAKRKELSALWTAEKPDRAAISAKQGEMDGLRQKMRQVHLDQRLAYLALLTPGQRAAWRAGVAGRGGPGMGGPGMGGPGMGGPGMGGPGMGGPGMRNLHPGMGNLRGGMGGPGMGMHGGPPLDATWADECLGYMDCDAACVAAPPPPAAPAPSPSSKPAGPPSGSR